MCRKLSKADNEFFEILCGDTHTHTSNRRTFGTPGILHCKNQASTIQILKMKKISPTLLRNNGDIIGEGVFGVCKKSSLQGTAVCVKEIKDTHDHASNSALLHEASILSLLSHQSLCWLIGIQLDTIPNQLVLPFYSVDGIKVELYDILFKKDKEVVKSFNEHLKQPLFWTSTLLEICKGLQHIHSLGLVYRDLKTDNVVFYQSDESIKPVIVDFGKCQYIQEGIFYHLTKDEQMKYSKEYKHIAPDLIEGKTKPTPITDIYSYGRLMKHVLVYGGVHMKVWSKKVIGVCKECLHPCSSKRPSITNIITALS